MRDLCARYVMHELDAAMRNLAKDGGNTGKYTNARKILLKFFDENFT